jgi:hypothetical protein
MAILCAFVPIKKLRLNISKLACKLINRFCFPCFFKRILSIIDCIRQTANLFGQNSNRATILALALRPRNDAEREISRQSGKLARNSCGAQRLPAPGGVSVASHELGETLERHYK